MSANRHDLCPHCGQAPHDDECSASPDVPTVVAAPPAGAAGSIPGGGDQFGGELGSKLAPGALVGEYRVVDRVGEGGMGTVYCAVHPIIGKKVAIKVLAARLAENQNAIRRFVLEARAVNDIRHPGLVDIFSFGQLTDGRHYYVMEFLDGRNLSAVLGERGRLPMAEAIPIFLEVALALVAVHAKGIVHRDLKPENILLLTTAQPGGQRIKLVDFGLAKLVEGVPAHLTRGGPRTAAGVNVGTPHYMSPEQCRGMKVDARSDLYSLGVVLYETLTGRVPFDGPTHLDIWQAHVEQAPRPPSEFAPDVSPAMTALLGRLLAKPPERRIQSARELCQAIEGLGGDGRGRTGARSASPDMHLLGQALSTREVARDLVALDALDALNRWEGYDELATTTEDLPVVPMPLEDGGSRPEVGHALLYIEEPAKGSCAGAQVSARAIDLTPAIRRDQLASEPGSQPTSGVAASPLGQPKLRPGMRPIEERDHQLEPPSGRARPASDMGDEGDGALGRSGRAGLVLGVAALLLVTAVVVVFLLLR